MNKRKILTLAMALSIIAIMAVGATLAYFTDTDEAKNVFTVGNVEIKILESKLHRDNDGADDKAIINDAENYQDYLATAGKDMVPGRWVKKAPYVQNTGSNAAYVRLVVTQSDAMWKTTSLMEYTTAMQNGAIVAEYPTAMDKDGNWVTVYTFTEALDPEEVTYYAPFWQIKIKDNLDQDMQAWNKDGEVITVVAEAIQADGFENYEEAFAAYDAQEKN